MRTRFYFFMLIGCAMIAGCAQEQKKAVPIADTIPDPVVMDPFRYHKLIEVSPGQYYDILSWGRGAANTGSFLILHSDSLNKKFTTTTGDLDGTITDVYNSDMDMDGHPEILIQAKSHDTTNYTNIYAFEFYDNRVQKLDFPKLSSSLKKGYRGDDNFYIEEGKLMREYPTYTGSGIDAKPTGKKVKLAYGLSNNNFTVKQLNKDSTSTVNKPVVTKTVKAQPQEKQSKSKKAEKKHHKPEKHKKKRRHHNDD